MPLKLSSERVIYSLIPCFVLATVIAILRIIVRVKRHKKLDASDYAIIVAWGFFVAYTGIVLKMAYNPSGSVHIGDMDLLIIKSFLPRTFASQICAAFVATAAKISLLLFWGTIFPSRQFRLWNYAVMTVVVLWLVAVVFLASFRCSPVSGVWDIVAVIKGAKCIDTGVVISAYEAGNIFTDVLIVILPLNQLRKLQMRTSKKIGVGFVFALGGLVIVTSAVRLYYANNKKLPYFNIGTIVDASRIYLWSNIQNSASIICPCLPMLVPLLRPLEKFLPSLSSAGKSLLRGIRGSVRTFIGARGSSDRKSPLIGKSNSSSEMEKGSGAEVKSASVPSTTVSHQRKASDASQAVMTEWSNFTQRWRIQLPDPLVRRQSSLRHT